LPVKNKNKNMPKVHPGHDVLSLFSMAHHNTALNQAAASRSLTATLISAFLIIIVASLALAFSTGSFSLNLPAVASSASASTIVGEEAVAYQPSQAVSQTISQGYLSK